MSDFVPFLMSFPPSRIPKQDLLSVFPFLLKRVRVRVSEHHIERPIRDGVDQNTVVDPGGCTVTADDDDDFEGKFITFKSSVL